MLAGCGGDPLPAGPREGEPFPDLVLERMDGGRMALTGLRGKVLVLNVWAPWCAPCVEEMPSLQRLSENLDPAHFAVLGLTVDDDPYLAEEFLRRTGVSFPNFMDRNRRVANGVLGVAAFPETFIIARDGTLVGRVTGARAWDRPEVMDGLERTFRLEPDAIVGAIRGNDG